MSKLKKLIAELCPDGVEFVSVEDVVLLNNYKQVGADELEKMIIDGGDIPLLPSSRNYDWYTTKEVAGKFLSKGEVFVMGRARHANTKYANGFFVSSNNMIVESKNPQKITTRFLYHYSISKISEFYVETATYPKFDTNAFKKLKIPIPPIEVQKEIVRILDKFVDSKNGLISLLEQELILRKKQYEYYRDQLLTFDSDVESVTLGEIGKVSMCKRIMKSETSTEGDVPFYKIGTFGKTADAFISKEIFQKYKTEYSYPQKGDVLISASGTIGRTVIFDGEPAYFQDSNIVWLANDETKILNAFLFYWYQTNPWKISTGGTISRLYNDNIAQAKVPLISIETQKKIVATLDRFDKLCNDLTSGIPAEIHARQKQYEFYRDKLLTFKER